MAIRREAAKIETKDMQTNWNPEWPITVRAKVVLSNNLIKQSYIDYI